MALENKDYKYSDYLNRSNDPYAMAKYGIVMRWLPARDNLKVLNAGCGSGEMSLMLCSNPTWSVDAIDVDEEAIKLSQSQKSEFRLQNLNVIHTGIELFKTNDKYDVVVCNDVLEHIDDDIAAIRKLHEMLRVGGILCVSVPAMMSLFGYHDEMLGHYRRYNKKTLKEKLTNSFEIKKSRYFGFSMIPVALTYSRFLRKNYPIGNLRGNSIKGKILKGVFRLESSVGVPVGISLLAIAVKK